MMRNFAIAFLGTVTTLILVLWNTSVLDYRRESPKQRESVMRRSLCSSDFQVVENGSAFAYSAYIDDRPARDFISDPNSEAAVVRIFAYFLRTIDVRRNWKCSFWYGDQAEPIVANISRVTDLNSAELSLRFLVAMVICNLPRTPKSSDLRGVSLTSSNSNETNFLCVVDLRRSRSVASQQPYSKPIRPTLFNISTPFNDTLFKSNDSKEEPEQSHLYNVTFTVCTTPIHGSYYSVSDIVQFCEVSRIFGAEKFIFYVDENIDPSIRYCLESYVERGLVEIYAFTPPVLDGLHYHGQIVSITDCVYRTMYRTKYLINQDIDEVVVPVKAIDWKTLLNDIHTRLGSEKTERIASYSFKNQFFPLEATDDVAYSQSYLVKRYNIKVLLKTSKEGYALPHGVRSKVMARPERILIWHVHVIYEENLVRRNDVVYHVSKGDALLHHYRSWQTRLDFNVDRRMHDQASLIIERVHFGMGVCMPLF